MSLIKHAEKELCLAGLFDPDSDYEGMIGEAVLELVKVFAAQGHSGFSAHLTMRVFQRVAMFKVLTPLTAEPEEWMEVGRMNGRTTWQNKRQGSCFSNDGGKTWYDIDNPPAGRGSGAGFGGCDDDL